MQSGKWKGGLELMRLVKACTLSAGFVVFVKCKGRCRNGRGSGGWGMTNMQSGKWERGPELMRLLTPSLELGLLIVDICLGDFSVLMMGLLKSFLLAAVGALVRSMFGMCFAPGSTAVRWVKVPHVLSEGCCCSEYRPAVASLFVVVLVQTCDKCGLEHDMDLSIIRRTHF